MSTPDATTGTVRWHGVNNSAVELQREACRRILSAARDALQQRGCFRVVLAGGNTPRDVYRMLRNANANTDWSRWWVYFGDERCLPADDSERNSRMAADEWLAHVPIPQNQILVPPAELGAQAAAAAYANTLRTVGEFDLVLLGLGEDGHTASLFPGHAWGAQADAPDVLPVLDAPKLPAQRISLSARRLSHARAVLFLVTGDAKRDAVRLWRQGADIPASAVQPPAGVDVLVDAGLLLAEPT